MCAYCAVLLVQFIGPVSVRLQPERQTERQTTSILQDKAVPDTKIKFYSTVRDGASAHCDVMSQEHVRTCTLLCVPAPPAA